MAEFLKINRWGGEITVEDFNSYYPNKNRIKNQIKANMFNEENEWRDDKYNMDYKNVTLEDLRKSRIISNSDGRPDYGLTDEKWQEEFRIRKLFVHPYPKHIKKYGGAYSSESHSVKGFDCYPGLTNYQEYSRFINDILSNIRSGQVDYVYFIYQIIDLLKFHHGTLRTKYIDGYWKVWLENDGE